LPGAFFKLEASPSTADAPHGAGHRKSIIRPAIGRRGKNGGGLKPDLRGKF
jgi:hypothetical protein